MKLRKEKLKKASVLTIEMGIFALFYYIFLAGFALITVVTLRQSTSYLLDLSEIQLCFTYLGLILFAFFVPLLLTEHLMIYLGFEKFFERNGWKIKRA